MQAAAEGESTGIEHEPTRELLALAVKLTRTPAGATQEDIADLRGLGLSDKAIHDAVGVIAYFNFVNRLALGLGVELEDPARPPE